MYNNKEISDPCHGCEFSKERTDQYLFERPYVCLNTERIKERVDRTQTVLELGRLKEANYILSEAVQFRESFERNGYLEPEDSTITPHCYRKRKEGEGNAQ